ncbi:hypothetical protein T310_6912 [Rasamsonia emersonii CBS 393.64]|uniref:Uncharacterized protein n=1 Tax=Rasamsonia emersonii (strain ATCC 16479 / CBS 393.64 / IMI 116815) TaxID=1408163 RepID=A0A0F4YMR6_RASE3|nr:hypothetical protein T310_6912 [Rasamsonia emersonii CBS 393.64]KKA19121.1 hypothetical protein T310_6912 [Rasamsonia emersonii CBS 393.64]
MASGLPGPADVVLIFLPCFAVVVIGAWLGFRYYGKKQIQKRTPNQVYQVGHDDHSIQSQSSFQSPQAVGTFMPRRYIWGVSSLLELRLLWTLEYLNQVVLKQRETVDLSPQTGGESHALKEIHVSR